MDALPRDVLEELFRRESARVVGMLVRMLGSLDRAEEVFQETLVAAMEDWPASGIPDNPGAWLSTVARNRALDEFRRDRMRRTKHETLAREQVVALGPAREPPLPEAISDDRLRLVFTCCHPALSPESQVAITLKLVCGLTSAEIARAFLVSEPTIAQRLVRAKRTIQERALPYAVPDAAELPARLASVLAVVYLVFNEGYSASGGEAVVRVDLTREAVHLGRVLAELMPAEPDVHALLALMELQASRTAARVDADGNIVLLEHQDRSRWDGERVRRGLAHLERARVRETPGAYHLQAEIAACHAAAPTWAHTDWRRIATLYGALAQLTPSPVVELNRAVAIGMIEGPAAGLALVDRLGAAPSLREYHLLPATRADFLRRLERWAEARGEYERALGLTRNRRERDFLARRLVECRVQLKENR